MAADVATYAPISVMAATGSGAAVTGSPVICARCLIADLRNRRSARMPVPMAVAPRLSWASRRHHAIECSQIRLQQRGKRMKFLTIGHWYGVLQLRAANRHVIDMFVGQIVEGLGEFLGGLGERPDRVDKREFAGGRVGVVRGNLRVVDVVVRMDVWCNRRAGGRRFHHARLAITSFMFMFDEVPAPPCITSTGN